MLAAALRDPDAELLYRLPASEARSRRRLERRRRPSRRRARRDEGRAPRPGDRHPATRALAARPPRPAPQRPRRGEPRDRDRAPASRGARPARRGRGVAIARRPGRVRGAPAARARPSRRGTATARDARDRPAAAATRAPARGPDPRPALDSAVNEVGSAIEDLRTIAAGVRPPRLDEGLAAALADLARGTPVPVELEATQERLASAGRGGRLLRRVRGGHERRQARGGVARADRGDRRRRSLVVWSPTTASAARPLPAAPG